ncbi:transglycosylase SLT domain-containing protein [Bradyrhizobium genosp. L]|uniref:transglycosylase SLT domain-containing protein n=1 Tax=Bradyrhizobium genosp. L TaxID=83637 RepID=UPI0018A2F637|nr:transglycosylase SLT domain-containing protein [Bradyrhizobium genosp. L]QPF81607.1 transglycosylase SLT domain-containing protein [Bradyrhizobium genosp. L]
MRIGIAAALTLASTMVFAGTEPPARADDATSAVDAATAELPVAPTQTFPARAAIRVLIEQEVLGTGLPADIAEAVVFVESRYDSSVIGSVGEIGAMQVRPETAAMLGFRGDKAELARPEVNIHYGVIYLARAWRLAQGDLCRALMKYRAGHGEETMTPRSVVYCNRARNRLVAMSSPFAVPGAMAALPPGNPPAAAPKPPAEAKSEAKSAPAVARSPRPADVYARLRQGTPAASRAFWAVHEARVRAIKAKIEAKWSRRVAAR